MMALLNDWLSDPHLQEVCPRKSLECWLNGTIKKFRLIEILSFAGLRNTAVGTSIVRKSLKFDIDGTTSSEMCDSTTPVEITLAA